MAKRNHMHKKDERETDAVTEDLDQPAKSANGHPRSRHAASARASATCRFLSTESPQLTGKARLQGG